LCLRGRVPNERDSANAAWLLFLLPFRIPSSRSTSLFSLQRSPVTPWNEFRNTSIRFRRRRRPLLPAFLQPTGPRRATSTFRISARDTPRAVLSSSNTSTSPSTRERGSGLQDGLEGTLLSPRFLFLLHRNFDRSTSSNSTIGSGTCSGKSTFALAMLRLVRPRSPLFYRVEASRR
jgi:hypothetical protein